MSKPTATLLATPANPQEEKAVVDALLKIKPDLPIERIQVCYEVNGRCVCSMVNAGTMPQVIAQWFKGGKIRVLKGRGGPPVDAALFEMVKTKFTVVETRKP